VLRNNREQGRQVLEHVLSPLSGGTDRRLLFQLDGDGYTFRGGAVLNRILTGKLAQRYGVPNGGNTGVDARNNGRSAGGGRWESCLTARGDS
jgi:hypothetical protein